MPNIVTVVSGAPTAITVGEILVMVGTGLATVHVPVSGILCGLPGALSEMLRLLVLVPAACGEKVTVIVHSAPALKVVPHVLLWGKSVLVEMPERISGALPLLLSVTVCATLLVPTAWPAKVREDGNQLTVGPVTLTLAVPDLVVSCGDVAVTVTLPATLGAVSSPDALIVPALALQLTAEL